MKSESLMMTSYTFIFFLLNVAPSLQVRFSVIGPDLPLVIPPGEDAVLPCHLSPQTSAENMTIRWFKSRYQDLVHLYQRNEDRLENQMDEYRSRTTLNKDGITAGSVSLIIHNVRPSDSGLYTSFFNTGSFYEEAVMELKVAGLGSKPQIHLEDLQNGGIAVVCESSDWYPVPEALWKDEDGNNISSSTEVKAMDGKLQFHVKATYIFSGHPSTLSCCIRNRLLSQGKQSTVHIRDAFFQRISSCILSRLLIAASLTVLGILMIPWTVHLFNEQRKHSKQLSQKSGELLEEFGKLPEELKWRRIRRFAAAVTLDPDTANPRLILSEDGKSVRTGDKAQDLPDMPQRFTKYLSVLGKERLTSGRHYWEVEVGDKPEWDLGVCGEAAKRKEEVFALPERGFWIVRLRNGKCEGLYNDFTPIPGPRVPARTVGIFLDYEAGQLSAYNVDDRSLLLKFPETPFPPTLFPYFNPCSTDEGINLGALRILPLTGRE